jgi:hypothetical protein
VDKNFFLRFAVVGGRESEGPALGPSKI